MAVKAEDIAKIVGQINPLLSAAIGIIGVVKAVKDVAQANNVPLEATDIERIQSFIGEVQGMKSDLDMLNNWLNEQKANQAAENNPQ